MPVPVTSNVKETRETEEKYWTVNIVLDICINFDNQYNEYSCKE